MEANLIAFADDLVFLADSYIYLKKIVKHLEDYFRLNGLDVNVLKTKIIVFQKGNNNKKP